MITNLSLVIDQGRKEGNVLFNDALLYLVLITRSCVHLIFLVNHLTKNEGKMREI